MCAMIKQFLNDSPIDKIEDRSYLTRINELRVEIANLEEFIEGLNDHRFLSLLNEYQNRLADMKAELNELEKEEYRRNIVL